MIAAELPNTACLLFFCNRCADAACRLHPRFVPSTSRAAATALDFPYAGCARALSKSKYSVKPVTTFPGTNTICWTVQYSDPQCANPSEPCCSADLHKLQLDVSK